MGKVLSIKKSIELAANLNSDNRRIVLIGGCYDIIHTGHLNLIKNAKESGDFLFVLLESDQSVRNKKGKGRPINTQADRAEIVSSIKYVDVVIKLDGILEDKDYKKLILDLKPAIIAVTDQDPLIDKKREQADLVGAKVITVTQLIKNKSTSRIADLLKKDFSL